LQTVERRTIRKVSWRLLPLIVIIYFVAYIDRTNVSFAALTMNKDLGLSPYVFGWGAGIFFLGYFLFEVPSNVILEKVGARIWIARIMITWGLVSGAMAFASGPASFLTLRFLLGVAEAVPRDDPLFHLLVPQVLQGARDFGPVHCRAWLECSRRDYIGCGS
jgi:MFS transporter, ACS family, tartrate transporter